MNKYLIILIILALIIGGGFGYNRFLKSKESKPVETGIIKNFTLVAKKNQWRFVPEVIEVNRGDRVNLTIINEDDYDHGIAIEAFGVSQRIPAEGTIKVSFVATQAGEFTYFCSVPCGDGLVDGVKRGHFDQFGKIIVHDNMHDDMMRTEMMN
jgi:plastocyanin